MLRGGGLWCAAAAAAVRRGLGHQVLKLTPTTAKRDEMRPDACGMSREVDGKRERAREHGREGRRGRPEGNQGVIASARRTSRHNPQDTHRTQDEGRRAC